MTMKGRVTSESERKEPKVGSSSPLRKADQEHCNANEIHKQLSCILSCLAVVDQYAIPRSGLLQL